MATDPMVDLTWKGTGTKLAVSAEDISMLQEVSSKDGCAVMARTIAGPGGLSYAGGSGTEVVAAHGNAATIVGGSGGGLYQGGGNATITAGAGGSLAVIFGANGDQLYASGPRASFSATTAPATRRRQH